MTTMSEPVTIERLERSLAVAAYIVTLDGPKAVPVFERIERELAIMRSQQAAVDRARALLESYSGPPLALPPPAIDL